MDREEVQNLISESTAQHTHDGNLSKQVNYPELFDRPKTYIQVKVFDFGTDVTTGDGKYYIHIPEGLNDHFLAEVHAEHITAGDEDNTKTTDIQIANATQGVDMLSTKLTIDEDETGSDTAATAVVINAANDNVTENDILRIDVDAVPTGTAPKGLIVTLGFRQ